MQDWIENIKDMFGDAKELIANRFAKYVLIAVVIIVLIMFFVGKSYAGTTMIFDQPKSPTTQYLALKTDVCTNPNVLKSLAFLQSKGLPPPPGILREADGKYEGVKAGACWTEYKSYILIFWEDLTYTFINKNEFKGAI